MRSIFTAGLLEAAVTLPAMSATFAVAVRPVPDPTIEESTGQAPAIPEPPASAHVQWTTTSERYQPFGLGAATGTPESDGAVSSTLTPVTVAEAVLPALSAA